MITRSTVNGLTTKIQTVYVGNGVRYVTNTAPDLSTTVQVFTNGLIYSSIARDADGAQLSRTDLAYDNDNRLSTSTDARNGTTTFAYDNADRVIATMTPNPGGGSAAQTTGTEFDTQGRPWRETLSDGTYVTNVYWPTGELKQKSGSRTYPVAYTYDYAGRMAILKTWQNFAADTGTAATSWQYNPYSGQLIGKLYADTNGPTYLPERSGCAGGGAVCALEPGPSSAVWLGKKGEAPRPAGWMRGSRARAGQRTFELPGGVPLEFLTSLQRAEPVPDWLSIEPIASYCGGRSRAEKRTALRQYTQEPLRQGHIESPWKRVAGGLVLGGEDFAERLLRGRRVNMEEQTAARRLRPRVKWQQVVQAAEKLPERRKGFEKGAFYETNASTIW